MDYAHLIEELIAGCDLDTEIGKNTAYAKCTDYAETNIDQRRVFNEFMEAVAERLDVLPVRLNSFLDSIGDPPDGARIHAKVVNENLVDVTGNADGLRYLASLILELARDAVEHDHAHLYADEPPMCGDVYLTIYHEPDAWFERLDAGADSENTEKEEQAPALLERDFAPEDIAALCICAKTPPAMLLTPGRLYRVCSVCAYGGQKVWEKRIREGDARFFLFALTNDAGKKESFGFDLDDPSVLFISRQDVSEIASPQD